jgi:ATP synthase protein I
MALVVLGIGWYIAICIIIGVVAGIWLDGKVNTKPIFSVFGLIVGLATGIYGAYRMLLPFIKKGHS